MITELRVVFWLATSKEHARRIFHNEALAPHDLVACVDIFARLHGFDWLALCRNMDEAAAFYDGEY